MKLSNECKVTGNKVEFTIQQDADLDEVLEQFQNFLRACGYVIDYDKCLVLDIMDGN